MSANIVKSLSNALYIIDPAHTCCVENECTDEYDNVARYIIADCDVKSLEESIKCIFIEQFEIKLSDEVVNRICNFPIQ